MKKNTSIGQALKRARKNKSLSIKKVAPKVEINYTYLSKIENDHKLPSSDLIEKLCELYGEDSEKMIALLGELPTDIQEILKTHGPEVFDLIRKTYS